MRRNIVCTFYNGGYEVIYGFVYNQQFIFDCEEEDSVDGEGFESPGYDDDIGVA